MKKRLLSIFFSALIVLSVAVLLTSCSGKLSNEEAVSEVERLVKESYELNVIYFGEGLPFEDDGNDKNIYAPVSEDALFVTKEALAYKTRTVFSKDYAASMIQTAFYGEQGADGVTALYARYIIDSDGTLTVYKKIEGIEINQYDYSTITITKISRKFIKANITSTDGETVDITLIYQDGAWRIDSATY